MEDVMSICNAMNIAKYIVNKAYSEDYPVSNLQLQKLLYFVQGESIQRLGDTAFPEELEVWSYGPVVRDVYKEFKMYGAKPIYCNYSNTIVNEELNSLVDEILEKHGKKSAWYLVQMTHAEGTPWKVAKTQDLKVIPESIMAIHYQSVL